MGNIVSSVTKSYCNGPYCIVFIVLTEMVMCVSFVISVVVVVVGGGAAAAEFDICSFNLCSSTTASKPVT